MQPTNELRFVEREIRIHPADCLLPTVRVVKILQQKLESSDAEVIRTAAYKFEWRDVPLEKES